MEVPHGYCQCKCGERTPLAKKTSTRSGHIRGQPIAYIHGHNRRKSAVEYLEEDRGWITPCWVWQRTVTKTGYGGTYRNGKTIAAHKALWEDRHGPVPAGMHLHHLCRNKACVNPDHLEPVIPSVHPKVLDHAKAKRIRERHAAGETQADLAREYGVDHTNIWAVVHYRSWR